MSHDFVRRQSVAEACFSHWGYISHGGDWLSTLSQCKSNISYFLHLGLHTCFEMVAQVQTNYLLNQKINEWMSKTRNSTCWCQSICLVCHSVRSLHIFSTCSNFNRHIQITSLIVLTILLIRLTFRAFRQLVRQTNCMVQWRMCHCNDGINACTY